MQQKKLQSWHCVIEKTIDLNHDFVLVAPAKAALLKPGVARGEQYILAIEAGFDIELVKVLFVLDSGVLKILRGQEGTIASIWPAGTLIEARITVKTMDVLRIDPQLIMLQNAECCVAPNGDLITKIH